MLLRNHQCDSGSSRLDSQDEDLTATTLDLAASKIIVRSIYLLGWRIAVQCG